MSEKGMRGETMQERRETTGSKLDVQSCTSPAARGLPVDDSEELRATKGSKLKDQSSISPAAHSLPVDDPEFRARWPFFSPPPSVKFWSSTRRVCAEVDDKENLREAKRQKPVTGGAEPARISAAFLQNDNSSELICSHSSMGLTKMVDMPVEKDTGVDVKSPDLVTVGKYQVKPSSKTILDRIFHKYGDIAAMFVMVAPESRSLVLDEVCEIIQSFEAKTFKGLILSELQRVVDRVRDFERAGLKIGWLLERLQDILEAYQLLQQASVLKEEKTVNSKAVKTKKREQQEFEQKLILVNQELKAAEAKLGRTEETILKTREKLNSYIRSPLLDKLL